jgi:hypothetical protein
VPVTFNVSDTNFQDTGALDVKGGEAILSSAVAPGLGVAKITAGAISVDGPASVDPTLRIGPTDASLLVDTVGVTVGDFGKGTLFVGPGSVLSPGTVVIGNNLKSDGELWVNGLSQLVAPFATVTVGNSGRGALDVLDGAGLDCSVIKIAAASAGVGTLSVSGAAQAGTLDAAVAPDASATIYVNGLAGSLIINGPSRLAAGERAWASVTVSDDAQGLVTNGPTTVGTAAGSRAVVTLDRGGWWVGPAKAKVADLQALTIGGCGVPATDVKRSGARVYLASLSAELHANSITLAAGGYLEGEGTATAATVTDDGSILPGNECSDRQDDFADEPATGTLNVVGDLTVGAAGTLGIDIGAAGNDQLEVQGAVTLAAGSTLVVSELPGYEVESPTNFTIVTYTTLNGAFGTVDTSAAPLPAGLQWGKPYVDAANKAIILPVIARAGKAVSATEGEATPSNTVVATVGGVADAADAANFTATINWGDGTTPTTNVAATYDAGTGAADVDGGHTYAEEGKYAVVVTIENGGAPLAVVDAAATVADADLAATVSTSLTATEGAALPASTTLATFTDAAPGNANDYTATVDWGDGAAQDPDTSIGHVQCTGGGGTVTGGHTYAKAGTFTVTVTVSDVGGSTAKDTGTIVVSDTDSSLSVYGREIDATPGTPFSGIVAEFVDEAPQDPGTYDATINWGDGTGPSGIIASLAGAGWAKVVPRATPGARRARRGIVRRRRGERVVVPSAA